MSQGVPDTSIRFSIAPPNQIIQNGRRRYDLDGFVQESAAASAAGFHCVYTGERRSSGATSYSHNPMLLSAYGLGQVEGIMFSAGLVVLPLHHPVEVVQDATMLAVLHPGRFRLCVGAGYMEGDFQIMGVDHGQRAARMEQGLQAINAYLDGREVLLDGPYRGRTPVRDEAVADVELEVFAGAWSPGGVRRAARYADGWITGPIRNIHWLADLAQMYREECERVGKEPRIVMLREAWLGDSDQAAIETYGEYVLGYHRVYMERGNSYHPKYEPWFADLSSPADLTVEHVLTDRVLCGSLEHWLETLPKWIELVGPEEIILRLRHFPGPTLEETLESIERIGAEVVPRFSGYAGDPGF
ncbi:MAG: LLM class flavin-dependent oxidoreductase [bacterium]|nr:LLM class flavin-dependent oxidoreductase [bacterium]